jgi:hypothetical protein
MPGRTLRVVLAGALAAIVGVAGSAFAKDEERPVSIPFANLGSVRDFRALSDDVLLIEGTGHRWYRATLFGPCIGLRHAESLAFVTEPGGALDRFSAIYVEGRRCTFRSFERTDPPAKGKPEAPPKPVAPAP